MVKPILAVVLYVLRSVLMGLAICLLLLTGSLLSVDFAVAAQVAPLALMVTHLLPPGFAFWGVLASPLGGVFRTDFVIAAIVLMLLAKLVKWIARTVS